MTKSKASFSKKEKEKEKQKKRKEKAEKKEERKSTSNKGKGLEDMLAYVDEYGVISSSPPDLSKKKSVKRDDIQISIPKSEHRKADERNSGTVTFFNSEKGFGFIIDAESQEKIFVHVSGLVDEVQENDKVTYKKEYTPRGISAVDVRK